MKSFLILVFSAFCLLAAAGCAPVEEGEYDDYRGGGYLE